MLANEELDILRRHPTIVLESMLEQKISLLNSLAEDPAFEDEALGLTFVDAEWPSRLRDVIAAIRAELKRRKRSVSE